MSDGGHSLREHLEATNHARAFDELRRLAEGRALITLDTILRLHALVLHDIEESAGTWRSQPVYIRGSDHQPPDARQVPELMRQWVFWLSEEGKNYHPVVRGAISHHGFVAVHPFIDGNGRCSRFYGVAAV